MQENPYTSDVAISAAKSALLKIPGVEKLLSCGCVIFGGVIIQAFVNIGKLNEYVISHDIDVCAQMEFSNVVQCLDICGWDCAEMTVDSYVENTARAVIRSPDATWDITFGPMARISECARPTFECMQLQLVGGVPRLIMPFRTQECPDLFTALDHLYSKQIVIGSAAAYDRVGNSKKMLQRLQRYTGDGFKFSTQPRTIECIRAKLSLACSLVELNEPRDPYICELIGLFYPHTEPGIPYTPKRSNSAYFISMYLTPQPQLADLFRYAQIAPAKMAACMKRAVIEHNTEIIIELIKLAIKLNTRNIFANMLPEFLPYVGTHIEAFSALTWAHADLVEACRYGFGEYFKYHTAYDFRAQMSICVDEDFILAHTPFRCTNVDPTLTRKDLVLLIDANSGSLAQITAALRMAPDVADVSRSRVHKYRRTYRRIKPLPGEIYALTTHYLNCAAGLCEYIRYLRMWGNTIEQIRCIHVTAAPDSVFSFKLQEYLLANRIKYIVHIRAIALEWPEFFNIEIASYHNICRKLFQGWGESANIIRKWQKT